MFCQLPSILATIPTYQGIGDHDVAANRYVEESGWGATPTVVMNSTYRLMDVQVAVSPCGQVSIIARSSDVAMVSTRLGDGSWTAAEDVTTIEGAISLQMVDDASLHYIGCGKLVVSSITNIGGVPDAVLTLCD